MCGCSQFPLPTQLGLCSLFKRHLFHSVWVWILKRCTEGTTWTCSCTAAIFRAAQKRLERNVRPTCGPAKIILQQKDFWNYKYFFPITENWKSVLERVVPRDLVSEGLQWRKTTQQALASVSPLSAMKVAAGVCRIFSLLSLHVQIERDLWWCSILEELAQGDRGREYQGALVPESKNKMHEWHIGDKCVALCTVGWTPLCWLVDTNAG